MNAPDTIDGLPARIEAVESKLAWLEKTADDLDLVLRETCGRIDQIEQMVRGVREQLEGLREAVAGKRSTGTTAR